MNFDEAFEKLLGHEGGYVDHPADPGGATRWGVTERVARANGFHGDMREYPVDHAKGVYRKLYWHAVKADELPPGVRYAVFDAAVNSGVEQSVKWLQRAVGAKADGVIGPETLRLTRTFPADTVLRRILAQRLRFMTELRNWPSFGRGWARRIADLMEAA